MSSGSQSHGCDGAGSPWMYCSALLASWQTRATCSSEYTPSPQPSMPAGGLLQLAYRPSQNRTHLIPELDSGEHIRIATARLTGSGSSVSTRTLTARMPRRPLISS